MRRQEEHYVDLKGLPPMRCDKYISEVWALMSRSQIRALSVRVCLDGKEIKLSQHVHNGRHICVSWEEIYTSFVPEKLDLDILYEDDDVWVINKPSGMVVHPGAGHCRGTLSNGLAYLMGQQAADFPDVRRAGIVHRLDKDTSGIIICAKHVRAHEFLSNQFRRRRAKKQYLALCHGTQGRAMIGRVRNMIVRSHQDRRKFICTDDESRGRLAVSSYRVIRQRQGYGLVLLMPHTGRTHQLRVHAKYWGFPIIGDILYNPYTKTQDPCLMLHAWKLKICLPHDGQEYEFCAPVPQRFYDYWQSH